MLRPALPRRLKQSGNATKSPTLVGFGSQFACQNAMLGAVGTAKHSVLMQWVGFPGFVSVLQPGPPSRLGKAQSSPLLVLDGSDPVPQLGVNGTPSLAVRIR